MTPEEGTAKRRVYWLSRARTCFASELAAGEEIRFGARGYGVGPFDFAKYIVAVTDRRILVALITWRGVLKRLVVNAPLDAPITVGSVTRGPIVSIGGARAIVVMRPVVSYLQGLTAGPGSAPPAS